MKRYFFGGGSLLLLLLLGIYLYQAMFTVYAEDDDFKNKLLAYVKEQQGSHGEVFIDFKEITDFPWEQIYIFSPYTSKKDIEKILGRKWLGSTSIEFHESISLLVFVNDQGTVKYIEYPRIAGDFTGVERIKYNREEAIFYGKVIDGWLVFFEKGD